MSKIAEVTETELTARRAKPVRGTARVEMRPRSISALEYIEPTMPNSAVYTRLAESYLQSYDTTETRPTIAKWLRFNALADTLFVDTLHVGNPAHILRHPAYAEIKRMGSGVVPFVFYRIDREPNLWLVALRDMTRARPVKRSNEGKVSKMVADWKRWAKSEGLLTPPH